MSIKFTTNIFPRKASTIKKSGLPWAFTYQPLFKPSIRDVSKQNRLARYEEFKFEIPQMSQIARCVRCLAYVNHHCTFVGRNWYCAVCRAENSFNSNGARYKAGVEVKELPEIRAPYFECNLEEHSVNESEPSELESIEAEELLVCVALVDVTGDKLLTSEVIATLTAAVTVLPDTCLFGLVSFSDHIDLWDLRHVTPVTNHVAVYDTSLMTGVIDSPSVDVEFEEVLQPDEFFVPVRQFKAQILTAIDSLAALNDDHLARQEQRDESDQPKRALGTAIKYVLDYVTSYEDLVNVRLMTFTSGACNWGLGKVSAEKTDLLPKTSFYRTVAEHAASKNVAIDVTALRRDEHQQQGLASLKFLCSRTGGHLRLYDHTTVPNLSTDITRQLSAAQGYHGLLRIRTSPNFRIKQCYGPALKDTAEADLYHVPACDAMTCLAFDLEFDNSSGFSHNLPDAKPSVQTAFAYSYLEPFTETVAQQTDERDSKEGPSTEVKATKTVTRYRLVKRLAVTTVQRTYSGHILELLHTTDAETVLAVLTRKILRTALDDSIQDAQLLLQDWLTMALYHYNNLSEREEVDVNFLRINHLIALPRWIYGLWKSPLLSSKAATSDPDWWTWMQTLVDDISPQQLRLLFYPDAWTVTWDDVTQLSTQWTAVNPHLSSFEAAPKGVLVYDSWHTAALVDWGDQDPQLHDLARDECTARLAEPSRRQQVSPRLITCQYDVNAPLTDSNIQVLNLLT
eukprot:TRINITY_DN12499_c0_g1_i1.p1 TRINITY_DN12499_c0_g1~~TRINITY_DN12499_c0_g1_i1.p1  ORF type:complete len:738 (+),score=204.83 TRINITY_DN12499_c0_g1_i1:52-2265(+)